jgi:hypothetical protein
MSHLIRDEGDEGRDHESEPTKYQGTDLVDETLHFFSFLFSSLFYVGFFFVSTFIVDRRKSGSGKGCGEMGHLIRDEGDEGRDHESESAKDQGTDLVDETLASPSGQYRQGVVPLLKNNNNNKISLCRIACIP